jgi:hypothetical protein
LKASHLKACLSCPRHQRLDAQHVICQLDDRAIGAHAAAGQCPDGRYSGATGQPVTTDPHVVASWKRVNAGCRGCSE